MFWKGYRSENQLDEFWASKLQTFQRLGMQSCMYVCMNEMEDVERLNEHDKKKTTSMRRRILGEEPHADINFDFQSLKAE
ncbi:MAG: hypothetical protein ACFFD4_06930 [Candidatus Odinarchaeota archaeon]